MMKPWILNGPSTTRPKVDSYTIYRLNLDTFEAQVFKIFSGSEYDAVKEVNKMNLFSKRNKMDHAFTYRADPPSSELVIPVL